MLKAHDDARRYYYFVCKFTPRNQWLSFLVRYTWQCLKQFYNYAKSLERAKADAIIVGFWRGLLVVMGQNEFRHRDGSGGLPIIR
jgi:hypothetical protein